MPVMKINNVYEYSIVYRISNSNDSHPMELSRCHKLRFSNPYIFPLIFQTMNSVRFNNLSIKYHPIKLEQYRDFKIWVYGKDSIPLQPLIV